MKIMNERMTHHMTKEEKLRVLEKAEEKCFTCLYELSADDMSSDRVGSLLGHINALQYTAYCLKNPDRSDFTPPPPPEPDTVSEEQPDDPVPTETAAETPEAEADEASIIDRVHVVSLDEYFRDREPRIDMIKADVEGSELALLQGAQEIIRRDRPNLAISLYHKLTDYFELPLYIKSLVPEYHLRICHHSTSCTGTVVYAYVD